MLDPYLQSLCGMFSYFSSTDLLVKTPKIFNIINRIFLTKEIWKTSKDSLYLSYENNKMYKVMNFPTEEELEREYLEILNEGFEDLSKIIDSNEKIKHIAELTEEQAINAIDWIEKLFIEEFEKREEYEKCSRLKELVVEIKLIKQI